MSKNTYMHYSFGITFIRHCCVWMSLANGSEDDPMPHITAGEVDFRYCKPCRQDLNSVHCSTCYVGYHGDQFMLRP